MKLGLPLLLLLFFAQTVSSEQKPNFIIIYTDDLGYGDLSCYGAKDISTPNIDQMAKDGVRMLDFYATSASCTPSRAALMTGCYPGRVGLNNVLMPDSKDKKTGKVLGLNPEEVTIAEVVKAQGYATACIGKWHLGDDEVFMPNNHGFDYFFGIPYSNDMVPPRFPDLPLMRNRDVLEVNPNQDFLTKRLTEEAMAFVEKNREKPFFLYLAHPMPHRPCHASPAFLKRFSDKQLEKDLTTEDKGGRDFLYPAAVEEIDWSTGEILRQLESLGLAENTLVIFTSDNGPMTGSAGKLRGKKGSVYEGGHRVPAIIQWKGSIPANTVTKQLVTGMDFLPTFAHLSGYTLPARPKIDGMNVASFITTEVDKTLLERTFFYNHGGVAVREGNWKFIRGKRGGLYNLESDISEKNDLRKEHPEKAERLNQLINDFQIEIKKDTRKAGSLPVSKP
ncbi:MAG: sulfatase family protein [Roseibacillus sp.]